ncbi:hypothetical protein BaRGS_00004514 [Batillaria attramentaria]|uniref:Uncharacterized protein n=1 Tax=Batillaria attramentaria TaxID=370345 RepID=A0ABD0LYF6_9CAEN
MNSRKCKFTEVCSVNLLDAGLLNGSSTSRIPDTAIRQHEHRLSSRPAKQTAITEEKTRDDIEVLVPSGMSETFHPGLIELVSTRGGARECLRLEVNVTTIGQCREKWRSHSVDYERDL